MGFKSIQKKQEAKQQAKPDVPKPELSISVPKKVSIRDIMKQKPKKVSIKEEPVKEPVKVIIQDKIKAEDKPKKEGKINTKVIIPTTDVGAIVKDHERIMYVKDYEIIKLKEEVADLKKQILQLSKEKKEVIEKAKSLEMDKKTAKDKSKSYYEEHKEEILEKRKLSYDPVKRREKYLEMKAKKAAQR